MGFVSWGAAGGTALLIAVHLLAGRFHVLVGPEKRPLHSVLTGITTAYLFLKLLPELGALGVATLETGWLALPPDRALFGIALLGFIGYYALEVRTHSAPPTRGGEVPDVRVYHVHLVSFTAFNIIIAFLLPHHLAQGTELGVAFLLAVSVHLLVLDHALAEVHGGRFGFAARAAHSAGLALGFLLGMLAGPVPSPLLTGPVLALFAGALTLQVIREEVPQHKNGRPLAFAFGAGIFLLVLVAVDALG